MTTDCPTGVRPKRRLAVLAAGATLAAPTAAMADPEPVTAPEETIQVEGGEPTIIIDTVTMGVPAMDSVELGIMIVNDERPPIEWSVWGRLSAGVATEHRDVAARRVTMPPPQVQSASMMEAAIGADITVGVAHRRDLRIGVWGEIRTSSTPVMGAELVLEGLRPHPYDSRIGGTGSLVLRVGANDRIVTGALGFGYVGSFPRHDPWIRWARHIVGARVVLSVNRAIDEPHDWSATLGLEVEPIGALHALYDRVTRD